MVLPNLHGGLQAFVGVCRRHLDVDDGNVGSIESNGFLQRRAVPGQPDHIQTHCLEQPGETLTEQELVVGDHDAHGNSRCTRTRGLSPFWTVSLPPTASTRSSTARRPSGRLSVLFSTVTPTAE